MYKLITANLPASLFLSRCYGSQRNQSNHYETLCVKNDASQKEIREAFIKLSKEHHPDMGRKESHSEFVKVNEAYNTLSKDYSRKQYDLSLKSPRVTNARGQAYYYHHAERASYNNDPYFWGPRKGAQAEEDYYRVRRMNRMSNGKVALICIVVTFLLVSLQLVALRGSIIRSRRLMNERSIEAEKMYKESKTRAENSTREEQLEALQNGYDAARRRNNFDVSES